MAISDITGGFLPSSFNSGAIVDKIYSFLGVFLLLVALGGIVTAFVIIKKKGKNKGNGFKIGWWYEVGGRMEPSTMDEVEEIIIPGTVLRIFHNKKKDLWIPRFTRGISKNLFYVLLTPTNQMVNFTIPSLSQDLKIAKLEYDHTDMLWAAENAREYIKRNYKDKAVKWWQLYQTTIATAVLLAMMTFCFILIIYFMRGLMADMGDIAKTLGSKALEACANARTSGVVAA